MAGAAIIVRAIGVRRLMKWIAWLLVLLIVFVFTVIGAFFGLVVAVAGATTSDEASGATCSFEGDLPVASVVGANGEDFFSLNESQWKVAAALYAGAMSVDATDKELQVMFAAAIQESKLQVYANESVPESLDFPHDQVATPKTASGEPVDALGALQQRPSSGWGEVAEIMDSQYAATAFLGGENGPNQGSPAGLRDIADWESMTLADAAESVQISGQPEHYAQWELTAQQLVETLRTSGAVSCVATGGGGSGEASLPFPDFEEWYISSGVGYRPDTGTGASTDHPAVDFTTGGACGRPFLAVRPGVVVAMNNYGDGSNPIWIQSDDGVLTGYLHGRIEDQMVSVGDEVKAGQQIGLVGTEGPSTGCHLDLRMDASAATDPVVAAMPRLTGGGGIFINPIDYLALFGVSIG
ncbi:M23 family metallopeptidase [Gulosibacter sediminis]|uniref:M23 family metallopeptidase n=1 Tax=Gulosibacter sediminis TaxID=1729695 RepID=UPI0024A8946A|nr:M23 family metallopeptidase [Gulosibacter sediminis]